MEPQGEQAQFDLRHWNGSTVVDPEIVMRERFAHAQVELSQWPPTTHDWAKLSQAEERKRRFRVSPQSVARLKARLGRRDEMDGRTEIERRIDLLSETLAELQAKKKLRDQLNVLYTVDEGAVVYWEAKFLGQEVVYKYAAVKIGQLWYTTAIKSEVILDTDTLTARLDRAEEIVLLRPFQRTLRTSRTVLEGTVQEVKEDEQA